MLRMRILRSRNSLNPFVIRSMSPTQHGKSLFQTNQKSQSLRNQVNVANLLSKYGIMSVEMVSVSIPS